MKRLTILGLILICFCTLCLGQRRPRLTERKIIQLTEPKLTGAVSFEEALAKRKSVRQFSSQFIKRTQIGQLAWAGQGIIDPQRGLRTAPSAGATSPIELLFATEEGLFAYRPSEHSLDQISDQDIRSLLAREVDPTQEQVSGAACTIILAGTARTSSTRLGNSARTHMLMECGHIAQNIQLQAVCLDLGSAAVADFNTKNVSKICSLTRTLEPFYMVFIGYPAAEGTTEGTQGQIGAGGKRAAFIVASGDFRDEELFETRRVLDAAQVQTVIASTRTGVIRGTLGNVAEASIPVDRLIVDDYDAIVFVGGTGAAEYFTNPTALAIARDTVRRGKVLAAIGTAPTILANANVLAGIRATSFLSEREVLMQAGAIYTGVPVERERDIITATGPPAAVEFGRAIVYALALR
jgi:protease I